VLGTFFGSTLDAVQERVALTCSRADFYHVNLKGEVKTTPENKKKPHKKPILKYYREMGKVKKKKCFLV